MKAYTTLMLCITVFFLFADQNLLAPNLSAIAKDFGFTDSERDLKLGAYIAVGYFMAGGIVAVLVGYFTDITNRCLLFGIIVGFGETADMLTFWATTYRQLLICRTLTAVSIGGSTPIIFSLLGDLYPGKSRVYVSTLIGISLSSGVTAGQLMSGLIGPKYGWHVPYLLVSIPALICALLVFTTVEEPRRGDQEQEVINLRRQIYSSYVEQVNYQMQASDENKTEDMTVMNTIDYANYRSPSLKPGLVLYRDTEMQSLLPHNHHPGSLANTNSSIDNMDVVETVEYNETIDWKKIQKLFRTKSVLLIYFQGLPGCLPWGMIYVFLNNYLSEDRGLSIRDATLGLTSIGIGGMLGQLTGGWFGQILYNINPRLQCLLMGASTIISVIPMLYLLNTTNLNSFSFYIMAVLAGFTININGPNIRVVLQVIQGCQYFSSPPLCTLSLSITCSVECLHPRDQRHCLRYLLAH